MSIRGQRLRKFSVVTSLPVRYADCVLWKKTWDLEAVLALIGGIMAAFFIGNIAVALLQQAGTPGFKGEQSIGSVLLVTLSFQGVALVAGTIFLKLHDSGWSEVFGATNWLRCLGLAVLVLVAVIPLMFLLKAGSERILEKLHWTLVDQRAVELIVSSKSPVMSAYLIFFAVILAPLGEEFFFRGLLFSTAKRYGFRGLGYVGVSFLFALIHVNAPTFLPLFLLALTLTWLYETTEGLLAPVIAHSLFNAANLVLLAVMEKYHQAHP